MSHLVPEQGELIHDGPRVGQADIKHMLIIAVVLSVAVSEGPFVEPHANFVSVQEEATPGSEDAKLRADLDELRALSVKARTAERGGRLPEAHALLAEAVNVLDRLSDVELDAASVAVVVDLGMCALYGKAAESGRVFWSRALQAHERTLPPDHPDLLLARTNLATSLSRLGDLAGARAHHEAVLEARERTLPEDHPDLLTTRGNLAGVLMRLHDYAGACALQEAVLEARERTLPEDDPGIIVARGGLASTLHQMGDYERARALGEATLEAAERVLPPGHTFLLTARGNLAVTLSLMGDASGAQAQHEAVLEVHLANLPEDHPSVLVARTNLAAALSKTGDRSGARALMEAVLEVQERTLPEDHPDLILARSNLAVLLSEIGDYPAARALKEDELEAWQRSLPEHHPKILMAMTSLGATMIQMHDFADARVLLEVVVEEYERMEREDDLLLAYARLILAAALQAQGDHADALAQQEAAIDVLARTHPEDSPTTARARMNYATYLASTGDLAEVRAVQEDLLESWEQTLPAGHHYLYVGRFRLALTLAKIGDLEALAPHVDALVRDVEAHLVSGLSSSSRAAGESVREVVEALSYLLFYAELLDSRDLDREVFEALELARYVSTAEQVRLGDPEAEAELETLRWKASTMRRRLNDLLAEEGEVDAGKNLAGLVLQRDQVEGRMRELQAASGAFLERIDADALADALPENAVAVGYRRHRGHWIEQGEQGDEWHTFPSLLANVLDRDGRLTRVDLGPIEDLNALVETWRSAQGEPVSGRGFEVEGSHRADATLERAAADALREFILDPVLAAAGEDVTTLYICLDDALFLVPLDALPMSGAPDADLVGERYDLRFESSFARLILPPVRSAVAPGFVALGDADFGAAQRSEEDDSARPISLAVASAPHSRAGAQAFEPLRGTQLETQALGEMFGQAFGDEPVLLLGDDATKAALRSRAPGVRWLHLATHGYFAPESVSSMADARDEENSWDRLSAREHTAGLAPMALCGLALAGANQGRDAVGRVNGILTAEELAGWDLRDCELAVLSACETNVGITRAGQGIQSLQAALHAAGARASITSLWKVDDEWTRKLMEDFYTRLWVKKEPKAEALWNAKMALRKQGARTRDWAGWVLVGDPD